MQVPAGLHYTEEHEWIELLEDGTVRVGITDYAQDQLGDVVFVELSATGGEVGPGAIVAEVESTKSVAEVFAPLAGSIVAVNERLTDEPELVNQSPYEEGWFVVIRPGGEVDTSAFLDAGSYESLIS